MSVAPSSLSLPSLSPNPKPPSLFGISRQRLFHSCNFLLQVRCARRSQRTGKLRYPSEKKRLRDMKRPKIDVNDKLEGVWRLSKLGVEVHRDPGKDFLGISDALLEQIAKVLEFPVASMLPAEAFTVVRKSFDARKVLKEPKFVYTVDMDAKKLFDLEPRVWDFISQLEPKAGLVELMHQVDASGGLMNIITDCKQKEEAVEINGEPIHSNGSNVRLPTEKPKVAVVGSGPAGLFATLVLAEFGADVTLIERGQPVEQRGRDIGALVVRRLIQLDSNFCFGEGGAGTWSDGKLVTRIGKNSASVQAVMKTLVHFGAPMNILVDGKPHLGTDRLVPLLRSFRQHLLGMGVSVKFGSRVDDLIVEGATVKGVKVSTTSDILPGEGQNEAYDAVVLAVGHSARDAYQMLLSHSMDLIPKDFAVGLRIEHPQELIDRIQYSGLASEVQKGRGKVPVADYKVTNYLSGEGANSDLESPNRGCYSFCMCPGGQIVLTSTNPSELCINGMSFSKRSSRWANAAIVVTVSSKDFESMNLHGPLAGVAFQLPGYVSKDALLHGVETRTSSPIQIPRNAETYESTSLKGLYPVGEGAGYAGGIVSAAVDGMYAGFGLAKQLGLFSGDIESVLGKAQNSASNKY